MRVLPRRGDVGPLQVARLSSLCRVVSRVRAASGRPPNHEGLIPHEVTSILVAVSTVAISAPLASRRGRRRHRCQGEDLRKLHGVEQGLPARRRSQERARPHQRHAGDQLRPQAAGLQGQQEERPGQGRDRLREGADLRGSARTACSSFGSAAVRELHERNPKERWVRGEDKFLRIAQLRRRAMGRSPWA